MSGQPSFFGRLGTCAAMTWLAAASASLIGLTSLVSASQPERPPWAKVEAAVRGSFESDRERRPNDVISQGEVVRALQQVAGIGWQVPEPDVLLEQVLADNDFLVIQLRTRDGRRFMGHIGGQKLMYDQLDRVARVPGGPALVRDLPRLPDAHVQARHLEQFLPKIGSGQARRVKDFNKPTGRIYTVDQLVAALRARYNEAS